jgi:type II secretion system protein G
MMCKSPKHEAPKHGRRGFTLIELLIVVAIIAILAAIAVPNFLEAQMRAKVTRVKSDMRVINTALEAYYVDNNAYPILDLYRQFGHIVDWGGGINAATSLSTPVAYLTTTDYADPFFNKYPVNPYGISMTDPGVHYSVTYLNGAKARADNGWANVDGPKWVLLSYGPDYVKGPRPDNGAAWFLGAYATAPPAGLGDMRFEAFQYDASNGTVSGGDILRLP